MKVAVLTQPLGKNYGGIIQAWALQQVLKKAGHEPVTIDRQADVRSLAYHAARLGYRTLHKVIGKRKAPINFERHLPYILQHTNAFIARHVILSEPLNSTAKLRAHFEREKYEAVVVGSDQTWRPEYSPNIDNFFLDFLKDYDIKRIAYATSFGVDKWEFTKEETQRCALLAKEFDVVSVREDSGVKLCQNYLGVKASHVLDPTLLLKISDYEALYKDNATFRGNGICTYILDNAEWKARVVETAKKTLNMHQYSNQPKANLSQLKSDNLKDYKMPSLENWIKSFADADFVITDSFHGTVFSIIFNKPFISLINPSRGASRFYSIADQLGLRDRLLEGYREEDVKTILATPMDYVTVDQKLRTLREKSSQILLSALKN